MVNIETGTWSIEENFVVFTEFLSNKRSVYTKETIKYALDTVIANSQSYVTNEDYERHIEHFRQGHLLSMSLKMKVFDFNTILESNGISNPEDSELYYVVDCLQSIGVNVNPKGPWIAGGSILRTFLGQPLDTDIDLFFYDQNQYFDAYGKIKRNALFVTESVHSSTFKILIKHNDVEKERKIQLVKFIFSEKAVGIISVFDINVCEMAFDGKRIVVPEESLEGIKNKRMKIHVDRVTFPTHTLKRVMKYVSRGFSIDETNIQEFATRFIKEPNSEFTTRY